MIDDESLVKTRTNTCLSYTSAVPSYSVTKTSAVCKIFGPGTELLVLLLTVVVMKFDTTILNDIPHRLTVFDSYFRFRGNIRTSNSLIIKLRINSNHKQPRNAWF